MVSGIAYNIIGIMRSSGVPVRHPNRQGLRLERDNIARKFKAARLDLRMTHQDCAKLLRVSVRTLQNWEASAVRIPHAAYKLLRTISSGKHLGPEWRDFWIRGDTLYTPEGHRFRAGDLAWWSLLIRQAEAFREIMRERRGREQAKSVPSAFPHEFDNAEFLGLQLSSQVAAPTKGSTLDLPTGTDCKQTPVRVSEDGIPSDFKAQGLDFKGGGDASPILTLPERPAGTHAKGVTP